MVSPQCTAPASAAALAPSAVPGAGARPAVATPRPAPGRPTAGRGTQPAGRGPQAVAPATVRRDPARPGARPARMDGLVAVRPVRGGCGPEFAHAPVVHGRPRRAEHEPAPLRLTQRGRRVVAGLSIAIGLSIAAATVVTVQLGADGGLRLAGSSTVVVQPGDSLWSIAQELAPQEDPRAVVDAIVDLNGLQNVDLLPGAVLQLP